MALKIYDTMPKEIIDLYKVFPCLQKKDYDALIKTIQDIVSRVLKANAEDVSIKDLQEISFTGGQGKTFTLRTIAFVACALLQFQYGLEVVYGESGKCISLYQSGIDRLKIAHPSLMPSYVLGLSEKDAAYGGGTEKALGSLLEKGKELPLITKEKYEWKICMNPQGVIDFILKKINEKKLPNELKKEQMYVTELFNVAAAAKDCSLLPLFNLCLELLRQRAAEKADVLLFILDKLGTVSDEAGAFSMNPLKETLLYYEKVDEKYLSNLSIQEYSLKQLIEIIAKVKDQGRNILLEKIKNALKDLINQL
jgi:hypothetical protein